MIQWIILFSRHGKLRLKNWYKTVSLTEKAKTCQEVINLVLARKPQMCNFLDHRGMKLVYRRYASLYFCVAIDADDNELITLEVIHRFVQVLDEYYGNVCELDVIYGMSEAYALLSEVLISGELQESSRKTPMHAVAKADAIQHDQQVQDQLKNMGLFDNK